MRRLMVAPTQFGSNSGYNWEGVDTPNEAHHDYCQLYQDDYSVRIWDPMRMQYSSPGYYAPNQAAGEALVAPVVPKSVHIRGIKGNAYIRFDGTADGVGVWRDPDGTLTPVQPDANATYAALAGLPNANFDIPAGAQVQGRDLNPAFQMPIFVALYRGTYKPIDDQPGWEIDSGPTDDPDVILGLDITDPQVLESGRFDWWDMDMVRLPHMSFSGAWTQADQGGGNLGPLSSGVNGGNLHRYAMNLDSNKRLSPGQVLWLHFKTGTIRLPVAVSDLGGTTTIRCLYYQSHKFTISVQASMVID